jgi:hypothetical protein
MCDPVIVCEPGVSKDPPMSRVFLAFHGGG